MKTEEMEVQKPEPRTIVLLTAISIGLGIAVDKIFFLLAAAIALIVPVGGLVRYVHELEKRELAHPQA